MDEAAAVVAQIDNQIGDARLGKTLERIRQLYLAHGRGETVVCQIGRGGAGQNAIDDEWRGGKGRRGHGQCAHRSTGRVLHAYFRRSAGDAVEQLVRQRCRDGKRCGHAIDRGEHHAARKPGGRRGPVRIHVRNSNDAAIAAITPQRETDTRRSAALKNGVGLRLGQHEAEAILRRYATYRVVEKKVFYRAGVSIGIDTRQRRVAVEQIVLVQPGTHPVLLAIVSAGVLTPVARDCACARRGAHQHTGELCRGLNVNRRRR